MHHRLSFSCPTSTSSKNRSSVYPFPYPLKNTIAFIRLSASPSVEEKMRLPPSTLIILTFLILGTLYALTTPLFEASDELWHYPMAQHLSRTFSLPIQDSNNVGPWRQEASQPPLYYYLMGWATSWIDTRDMDQVRWLNPHVDNGFITPDGNINLAIHTARENFPYGGAVLAVRLIRLLSVLMGAGTIYFTYLLAKEFFDDEPSRLFAAAFAAFTPMFVFISGAVNNDNLATFLSAIILFLLVHFVRAQTSEVSKTSEVSFTFRHSSFLGILLALAALTKQSALGSFGLTGLTLLAITFQRSREISNLQSPTSNLRPHFSFFIVHCSFAFLPSLFISAWWYIRNLILYGDLLGWSAFIAVLGKRAAPANLLQLWGERISLANSFWGLFGGVNVPMSDWIYFVFNTIAVIALAGCVVFFLRHIVEWSSSQIVAWRKDHLFFPFTPSPCQSLPILPINHPAPVNNARLDSMGNRHLVLARTIIFFGDVCRRCNDHVGVANTLALACSRNGIRFHWVVHVHDHGGVTVHFHCAQIC